MVLVVFSFVYGAYRVSVKTEDFFRAFIFETFPLFMIKVDL